MDTRRQMDLPMWKGSQNRKEEIPGPIPPFAPVPVVGEPACVD